MDATDVVVFFAPKQGRWVKRLMLDGFTIGDFWHEHEPTDEELRSECGEAVRIHRGYSAFPIAFSNGVATRMASR